MPEDKTPFGTYPVLINEANFPDAVFRDYVSANFDDDRNSELSDDEIALVDEIWIPNMSGCSSLEGIRYFFNLANLQCAFNQLKTLDLSGLAYLTEVNCQNNGLTSINLAGCDRLHSLNVYANALAYVDITVCSDQSGNEILTFLTATEQVVLVEMTYDEERKLYTADLNALNTIGNYMNTS
ncbi:MAG: hypothetical protein LBD85_03280, partial [Oscillospiraceae bacterium]|nr:hypothetical protein [Oscillospiraceae bacterium]